MKKYICIEGIIGSGKTTLAENLYHYLKHKQTVLIKEQFEDNQLLRLFYQSPEKYGFLAEYSFLIDRFHQLHRHFEIHQDKLTIADFSFKKCLWFAENNLSPHQFDEYKKHYFQLESQLNVRPDIIVFLDVKPDQALKNIHQRNRAIEKNIRLEYLEKLYATYQKHLANLDIPVFSIEVKEYESVFNEVLKMIEG